MKICGLFATIDQSALFSCYPFTLYPHHRMYKKVTVKLNNNRQIFFSELTFYNQLLKGIKWSVVPLSFWAADPKRPMTHGTS